jgi:ligand-binding sensor domain-containing protein
MFCALCKRFSKSRNPLTCDPLACTGNAVNDVQGPVLALHETSDGRLWIGTWGHGIYRGSMVNGGSIVEHLDHSSGLVDDFVHTMYEDAEHNFWISTRGGGVTRFRTTALKPIGIPEGVNGNYASAESHAAA